MQINTSHFWASIILTFPPLCATLEAATNNQRHQQRQQQQQQQQQHSHGTLYFHSLSAGGQKQNQSYLEQETRALSWWLFCGWSTTKFHRAKRIFHKIMLPKTNTLLLKNVVRERILFFRVAAYFQGPANCCFKEGIYKYPIQRSYIGITISRCKNPYKAIFTMDCHKGFFHAVQMFFNHMVSFVSVLALDFVWMDVFFCNLQAKKW